MIKNVYVERRDNDHRVIERNGPFMRHSQEERDAIAIQHRIAQLHNASRRPSDTSFQLVYTIEE